MIARTSRRLGGRTTYFAAEVCDAAAAAGKPCIVLVMSGSAVSAAPPLLTHSLTHSLTLRFPAASVAASVLVVPLASRPRLGSPSSVP